MCSNSFLIWLMPMFVKDQMNMQMNVYFILYIPCFRQPTYIYMCITALREFVQNIFWKWKITYRLNGNCAWQKLDRARILFGSYEWTKHRCDLDLLNVNISRVYISHDLGEICWPSSSLSYIYIRDMCCWCIMAVQSVPSTTMLKVV